MDIMDYRNASKNTTMKSSGGAAVDATFQSGLWVTTDALTSIALVPTGGSNFVRGSEFTLLGIQE